MKLLANYSNLVQRAATGIAGAALIIFCVAFSEWTYFAVFLLICALSLLEFYRLAGLDGMIPQKSIGLLTGIGTFALSFFIEKQMLSYRYYFFIFPLLSFTYLIKLYKNERKPFTNIAYTFLGVFYIAVPFSLLNHAVYESGRYNAEILLGLLLILWASDTGAYFAGIRFGRHKLFERISPKKSWEGFWGGAALAAVVTFVVSLYFTSLPVGGWLVMGVLIVVGGTFGDLVESLFKRSMEIKDSGNSLPGHGGFLDRFDGLLIAAPFIVAYLEIF
jgi:phosphatidate cytidylyltransferase